MPVALQKEKKLAGKDILPCSAQIDKGTLTRSETLKKSEEKPQATVLGRKKFQMQTWS